MGVRLDELTIRLNEKYIYGHHGNCEHRFVFTDMQHLAGTSLPAAVFPHKTLAMKQRRVRSLSAGLRAPLGCCCGHLLGAGLALPTPRPVRCGAAAHA